jgi:hypothetical protein
MSVKTTVGSCHECESSFDIHYAEELVSQEMPEYCPFCGEAIDDIQEEYIDEEDDFDENEEWE